MADAAQTGALALVRLQRDVRTVVDQDHQGNSIDAGIERHNFEAIDALVIDSIMANVVQADPQRRQGYVRSLAWLFHTMALECVPDVDEGMVGDVLRTLQATGQREGS
jgi:hypothetical protein